MTPVSEAYWQGKVVWLTGASSGLGEHAARELAATGCRLAITSRRADRLEELARKLGGEGRVLVAAADVTSLAEVQRAHDRIRSACGDVDVLIANAGTHVPDHISSISVDAVREIFEVNFFGALNCVSTVMPRMLERKSGHIAAVASVAGYRALPRAAAYGASKAALIHFMDSIRFDCERAGIAVSVVNPGFVRTPLTDKNTFSMPFLMEPDAAARIMCRGIARRAMEVHFPARFSMLMKLFRVLPYPVYHRLVKRVVDLR